MNEQSSQTSESVGRKTVAAIVLTALATAGLILGPVQSVSAAACSNDEVKTCFHFCHDGGGCYAGCEDFPDRFECECEVNCQMIA